MTVFKRDWQTKTHLWFDKGNGSRLVLDKTVCGGCVKCSRMHLTQRHRVQVSALAEGPWIGKVGLFLLRTTVKNTRIARQSGEALSGEKAGIIACVDRTAF